MGYKNILALSPHTDDVALGAGATLAEAFEIIALVHSQSMEETPNA